MGGGTDCRHRINGFAVAIIKRRRRDVGMDGGEFGGIECVAVGMGHSGNGDRRDICRNDRNRDRAGEIHMRGVR